MKHLKLAQKVSPWGLATSCQISSKNMERRQFIEDCAYMQII